MPNPQLFTNPDVLPAGFTYQPTEANKWIFENIRWLKYVADQQGVTPPAGMVYTPPPETADKVVFQAVDFEEWMWGNLRWLRYVVEQLGIGPPYSEIDRLTFGR